MPQADIRFEDGDLGRGLKARGGWTPRGYEPERPPAIPSGELERQRDAVKRMGARAAAFGRQSRDDREDELTQPGHVLPKGAEYLLLGDPLALGNARVGVGHQAQRRVAQGKFP